MKYLSRCNATHNAVCKCKAGYECKTKPCVQCLPIPATTINTTLTPTTLTATTPKSTGRTLPIPISQPTRCVVAFERKKKITWENTKIRSRMRWLIWPFWFFGVCLVGGKTICASNHIWEIVSLQPCETQVTGDIAGIVPKGNMDLAKKNKKKKARTTSSVWGIRFTELL